MTIDGRVDVTKLNAEILALNLNGFDGDCGLAAIEINQRVFESRARYVAALNELWLSQGRFIGHVALYWGGYFWDARGVISRRELEHLGALNPEDGVVLIEFDSAEEIRAVHEAQR